MASMNELCMRECGICDRYVPLLFYLDLLLSVMYSLSLSLRVNFSKNNKFVVCVHNFSYLVVPRVC